jgi:hypothetical protein
MAIDHVKQAERARAAVSHPVHYSNGGLMEDKKMESHESDQKRFSEHDGDDKDLKLAQKRKQAKSDDQMARITEAYGTDEIQTKLA